MGSKKFAKLNSREAFKRWNRTLQIELNTIPPCERRFELGHLVNPRKKASADDLIDKDCEGNFDGITYEKALMLYVLVKCLMIKVSNFLYSISFCLSKNPPVREIVRSTTEEFMKLYRNLRIRFEPNLEVEKEKLMKEFRG